MKYQCVCSLFVVLVFAQRAQRLHRVRDRARIRVTVFVLILNEYERFLRGSSHIMLY